MADIIATLATVGKACLIGNTSTVTCERYFDDHLLRDDLIANFCPDEKLFCLTQVLLFTVALLTSLATGPYFHSMV